MVLELYKITYRVAFLSKTYHDLCDHYFLYYSNKRCNTTVRLNFSNGM